MLKPSYGSRKLSDIRRHSKRDQNALVVYLIDADVDAGVDVDVAVDVDTNEDLGTNADVAANMQTCKHACMHVQLHCVGRRCAVPVHVRIML